MNAWYDRVAGNAPQAQNFQNFQNPMQRAGYILRALMNPSAFVKQQFPDVPDNIMNDPNQVLQYIQRTRGISDDQLRQIMSANPIPRF